MPVIGRVSRGGVAEAVGDYEIAAFCGDECRGVGVVVDGYMMISVFGNPGDEISFRLYSDVSHMESSLVQTLTFTEEPAGSLGSPYMFDTTATSVAVVDCGSYGITVENGTLVLRDSDGSVSLAEVYDTAGVRISSKGVSGEGRMTLGRLVPGVYVVVLHTSDGRVCHKVEVR